MSKELTVGQQTPDFTLPDSTGTLRSLSDFRGQDVVVYFYPAAFTAGCTTEACDFRDSLPSLHASGYQVLGVSPDPIEKIADFAKAESLNFPLLSDVGGAVADAWGAWGEKTFGKDTPEETTVMGVLRSTFVIDPSGVLVGAQYNVNPQGHVAKLRAQLGV
ncbi:peroxiredoxin [Rathayibacter soli]|uniref:peroxiredoxin n=1 Tax=Rathayibacter soli TaxID=3144168 RepID=UPI0027E442F9|nr:peroxiredoxin [Glaciibacter superstes]